MGIHEVTQKPRTLEQLQHTLDQLISNKPALEPAADPRQ